MKIGRTQNSKSEFLSEFRKHEISCLAGEVSQFYCRDLRIVEPEIIANKSGITFSYGNYIDAFDGLIECLKGKFHIYVNIDRLDNPYSNRARFTFAHELGHYFIDDHRNALKKGKSPSHSSFTGFVSRNYAEREADYFASCLLLPEDRVKKDVDKRKFQFELLKEISTKYQTSFTAAALRFSKIGNHPIMVVLSQSNIIKWYGFSEDFPFRSLLHGKDRVPEDTVAGEYYSKSRAPANKQEVFAIDWFKNVWESDTNRKFYEQCLFHKQYVISILWED